jgi:hypothetical protein
MKFWIVVLGIHCSASFAADVRVIEPARRSYSGALSFIQSDAMLESHCISVGVIVIRGAPFSDQTIRRMQSRARKMGADTLVIKDTTVGPVSYDYVIRMGAYKCNDF